jgi:hypothetical protein
MSSVYVIDREEAAIVINLAVVGHAVDCDV